MQCVTRPRITELNPHLLCVLCGGYYIDATAIIECLHSFCKSCIIRYLETRKYCPICDVLVHKTKPLQNLRPDTVLQSMVYKLVPNLYEREMRNRRNYYSKVPTSHHPRNAEEKGVITESSTFYSSSDTIDFSLEYVNYSDCHFYVATNSQKYFRCQACVKIEQLRKLIEAKYTTTDDHRACFYYNEIQLPEHLTLLDVAYISAWKRRGFIRILFEIQIKRVVIESNLKLSPLRSAVEASSEIPPPTPATTPPCVNSAPVESAMKTETSNQQQPENVFAASEPTKESSPTPDAANLPITSASTTVPSAVVADDKNAETAVISTSSVSISSCSSSSSVTVTCSMNNDDITTSSVGTPITTSVCVVPVNGLSPSPKVTTPTPSPRAAPEEVEPTVKSKLEETPAEEIRTSNTVEEVTPAPVEKSEDKSEKARTPSPPIKRSLEESEKSVVAAPPPPPSPSSSSAKAGENSSEMSAKPAKIPKLSGLVEKVLSAHKLRGLTIEVQKSTHASTASVSSPSVVTAVVTPGRSVHNDITSVKASVTTMPTSRVVDCVQKSSPRPIFNRVDVPTITKSTTKIMKNFNRPWNCTTSTSPSLPDLIDVSTLNKSTKIIKARPSPPRYQSTRSVYEPVPLTVVPPSSKSSSMVNDAVAKRSSPVLPPPSKISPFMKIDPQTLSPILATTVANSIAPISPSTSASTSKKSYSPFLPPSELYAGGKAFTSSGGGGSGLSTYTSPNMTAKPPGSYVMPNPLLPINQFMYEMYVNGTPTLEYMKAMTTNFRPPSLFHPSLHPSIGPYYNSMQKKYEKKSSRSPKAVAAAPPSPSSNQHQSPPSVQRIPPSNNNTKLAISEHSGGEKRHAVSNGQRKHKMNKTDSASSGSSFSINNLIPLETEKHKTTTLVVSHACSADGVHQVCDQMPSTKRSDCKEPIEPAKKVAATDTESKLNNASKE